MRTKFWRLFLLIALLGITLPALAQDVDAGDGGTVVRQPAGAIIVPDQFLRRWDPVTIFFDHDMGRAANTTEDAPEKLVTMEPVQPGAWTWLNGRTLQFRPASPWPPLSQFTWKIRGQAGQTVQLSRLLDPTVSTDPQNGAVGLEQISSLSLTFSEPLDVKALAGMLDVAVSQLPGLDPALAQHLTPADFDIKTMERTAPGDNATYVVEFHQPIPDGMHVAVSIGLSPVPGLQGTVEQLDFATAQAFRPTLMGCADQRLPLSAAGTVYDETAALACGTADADSQASDGGDADQNADQGSDQNADQNADQGNDQPSGQEDAQGPGPSNEPASQLPVTSAKHPTVGAVDAAVTPGAGAATGPARMVVVEFSANPAAIGPIAARNFIRITPAVDGAQTSLAGAELHVTADFKTGTLYKVALEPVPLKDAAGRALVMGGESAVWLYWPPEQNFLSLSAGNGVVERYGPQMIPLSGRGYREADVRIHAIDPLDRSFWPFPTTPVTTNDNDRPPAPGEQAQPYGDNGPIDTPGLQGQIARLGSPSVSALQVLPLTNLGSSARFGLDLHDAFARISGRNNPGTYLVGVRALDQPGTRNWMRVQVSDLSVTTVEEEDSVRFVVTSLSTGLPVAGAKLEVDAVDNNNWSVIETGTTGADGVYVWQVNSDDRQQPPGRIVVSKDDDTLVIDPAQPPDRYTADGWTSQDGDWLAWTANPNLSGRHPAPQTLCHIFTERPIYRPEDPVHIKAYIRQLADGLLTPGGQDYTSQLVITGPDQNSTWKYNVAPDAIGDLHYLFDDKTTATGAYQAELFVGENSCGSVTFIKDAYRLPKFQILLNGPDAIPLDRPAKIGMTATYYAGGPAAGRPVRWRVTEFPYAFAPAARPGFAYATDALYQTNFASLSTAAIEQEDTTDKEGRASLTIDPTQEASNAPRRYVVEATVTGDDDKTVTNTQDVLALPGFVLALQAPRYLEHADAIPVQVLMVDAAGKPLAGRPITLTLLRRQWSSILQASDFSNGQAKYQTAVVDEKLIERTVISGADAVKLNLPIDRAGVYIVQIQAADALGRLQTVSLDLFAAGNNPVSWSRPPATEFQVTTDKPTYDPGDTAKLILQSPFQTARALAIVELPNGVNQYQWLDINNGYGVFTLPVDKSFMRASRCISC